MLSRREVNAFLEIVEASLRCDSDEDLCRVILRLEGLIPYDFALCALSKISCCSADPYRMVNVSYPVPWLERYISEQLDRVDPIITEHRLYLGLQYWPDSYRKHPEAKQFINDASAHGLKTGYSYGLWTAGTDSVSLFCFGGRSMDKDIRTVLIVHSIVPHLHQALLRFAAPLEKRPQAPDPGFSSREREVLNWIKAGKTAWEISQILSISERTVKFHIQNILRKVHAVSRAQAVAICLENGFIDID